METGGQCVMTGGPQWMPMWLVDSLAILVPVHEENTFVRNVHDDSLSFLSAQILLLIPVHTLGKTVLSS